MLTMLSGDIFASQMQTLVNPVNVVGIMGKGLALQFKKRFPLMFKDYEATCLKGFLRLGKPIIHKQQDPWIVSFPTKRHWREYSTMEAIETGMAYLLEYYEEIGIRSIAFPALGCGEGKLDWTMVLPMMRSYIDQMEIPVELYLPQ